MQAPSYNGKTRRSPLIERGGVFVELRDLKAPLCILAARFGGLVLALWGLLWGLELVLYQRPVGSLLGVIGFVVFLAACASAIVGGVSLTVWSVVVSSETDEQAGGWRPRFLRTCRRIGPHVLGFAMCSVVAVLMSATMTAWPLRLVHVDLVRSRVFVLWNVEAANGGRSLVALTAFQSTVMLVNLALTFSAFGFAMFLKRTSLFRRKSFLGTKAAVLAGVCLVFLPFICYPKVKGFVKARRFRRNSSVAVVTYAELPARWLWREGRRGYGGFAILTGRKGEPEPFESIVSCDKEAMRRFVVSDDRMSELVGILAAGSFFEMEACLYPYGTIDGTWEALRISDGECQHEVSSYQGEAEGARFETLRDRIMSWLGLGERWWEDGQGGTADDEEDSW